MRLAFAVALACVGLTSGCQRDRVVDAPSPPPVDEPASSPGTARDASSTNGTDACGPELAWRFEAKDRVVAIGDVHGDRAALRRILRAVSVIDDQDRWAGDRTILVQLGDVLDRGDDELEIMQWMAALQQQAEDRGGRVVLLNGNHELMNAAGDFRYVTEGGWRDFEDEVVPPALSEAVREVPKLRRGRIAAFAPGGRLAQVLARQPIVAVVGDSLFVHGGLIPQQVGSIEALNRSVQCWLSGHAPAPEEVLGGGESPVWIRDYGGDNPPCEQLQRVLEPLGVSRMVVAHTVQERITSACDGRLWRIDVGMAAHYGGVPAALAIDGKGPRAVSVKQ